MPYAGHAYDMNTTGASSGWNQWTVGTTEGDINFTGNDLYSQPKESMETKFKVGDRVEVHSMDCRYEQYNGLRCTITRLPEYDGDSYVVNPDAGSSYTDRRLWFRPKNLRLLCTQEDVDLVNKLNAPVFKVGDRVKGLRDWIDYGHGLVTKIFTESDWVGVRFDSFEGYGSANDCHRICPANLQSIYTSPQQTNQTNKPKEEQDMKPYAVIVHNLGGTEGSITGRYATEAEAQETAESLIASYRASVTQRTYFTVTILNTKTGELVGSVTDAPPVVDWAKK